jgi:hypothetical protein
VKRAGTPQICLDFRNQRFEFPAIGLISETLDSPDLPLTPSCKERKFPALQLVSGKERALESALF